MLENKVVVVTGGAGLIGRRIVQAVKDNNGIPVIADIDQDKAKKFGDEIGCDFIDVDITSKKSITMCLQSLKEKYQRIDCLINNAYPRNKNYGRKFEDVEYHDFCENVNLHLGGYFLISQQFIEYYKMQGFGNIINMSSIYGVIAPRFEIYEHTTMTMPVEYSAIKSGLIHLTKYIAKYHKGFNIRCNSISLGGIFDHQNETFLKEYRNFSLNKGMLDPEDIVGSVVFMISDKSKYINGQNIVVDDGWTL